MCTDVSSLGHPPSRRPTGHKQIGSDSRSSREPSSLAKVALHRAVWGSAWGGVFSGVWLLPCHLARASPPSMTTIPAPGCRVAGEQGGDSVPGLGDTASNPRLSLSLSFPSCKMAPWAQMIFKAPSISDFCVSPALLEKVLYCCSFCLKSIRLTNKALPPCRSPCHSKANTVNPKLMNSVHFRGWQVRWDMSRGTLLPNII